MYIPMNYKCCYVKFGQFTVKNLIVRSYNCVFIYGIMIERVKLVDLKLYEAREVTCNSLFYYTKNRHYFNVS